MSAALLRARFLLAHPDVEPYLDREVLTALAWLVAGFLGLTLTLTALGLILRRRPGQHRIYLHAVNQTWWLTFAVIGYVHGLATTPLWTVFPVLGFFCLLLFDARIAAAGVASALVITYATTVAERLGALPYAPIFAEWPIAEGRIADEWLWSSMMWPALVSGVTFVVIGFVLGRSRRHARRVAEMSDLLKQLFGRYMSTEVMNTLLDEPSSLALGGERRRVTILMSDLRGFTALAERLPPEEVIALLNAYFDVMVDVCLRWGGTINEIIGDALLVTFGAPKDDPDHCASAVACAIEMQNAMREVNERNARERRPELDMGIGINTAEVIVGNIGSEKRSTFGVVGSGVNMASRIESFTVGGQVLVSQSVVDEIGPLLRIDDRREVQAKGAAAPLTVYAVGGLGGRYAVALEAVDEVLKPPPRELRIRYVVLSGKRTDGTAHEAVVERLARTGLELASGPSLAAFDDVKLNLVQGSARLTVLDVYAKVVSVDAAGRARLRFTATPPEVQAYVEGILGI